MIEKIRQLAKQYLKPGAAVLMYHRVAEPGTDVWGITVSPANFEQHLQVLQKSRHVIPLQELTERAQNKSLRNNMTAITFDDGYIDNYLVAKPLLEKYGLPATFFITSGNIGKKEEFWWDDLECIILFSPHLPQEFSMNISGTKVKYSLQAESHLDEELCRKHSSWDACVEAPPSLRCRLFLEVWQLLLVLPYEAQQAYLQEIKLWANYKEATRSAFTSISMEHLQDLGQSKLINVGAHTVTHPALGAHNPDFQKKELLESRKYLQNATGASVNMLAYPYGNYNEQTVAIAAELGYKAAFTTEHTPVTASSHVYRLGRFQANNWNGGEFEKYLHHWLTYSKN